MSESRRAPSPLLQSLALASSVVAANAIGGAGALLTDPSWYAELERPFFAPPGWLFGPVWTALYTMMGIAAWRVWRVAGFRDGRAALGLYALQLVFNGAWTPIFFGLQMMGLALADILVLLALIVATIRAFRPIDRAASMLLVPYGLWVGFATALNASLWWLNR